MRDKNKDATEDEADLNREKYTSFYKGYDEYVHKEPQPSYGDKYANESLIDNNDF